MPHRERKAAEKAPESGNFASAVARAAQLLRERAQEELRARAARIPEDVNGLSPEATRKALHELRVYQIELELQNEELRRVQEELEVSRSRYFDLYELAPVGYLTIGEKGLVLEANLTAAGLLGVTMSGLINQPWTRFILPEDQDTYFWHRRQLLLSGSPQACELRLLKAGGPPLWAQLEARVADLADGTRVARTVLSDITERKRGEEALKVSEARHRVLFENSDDALMTLAPPSWQLTSSNAAALAMFRAQDTASFIAQPPWHYSPERQADGRLSKEKALAMIDVAMREGSHSFPWTHRRVTGENFHASVHLTRMLANGAPLLEASVRDETEARKEQALLSQREQLANMGMLAASVGHEINNPLAYVLSNLEALAQTLPQVASAVERSRSGLRDAVGGDAALAAILGCDAALLEPGLLKEASGHAQEALEGARRITRISRVLSTLSRVDTPEFCSVDLHRAIDCAVTMVFNEIRFRAKLIKDFGVVPAVWASEGKLSQVFLNLLVNASHARDEQKPGEHYITIRTWAEGDNVFVEIRDTGRGISPENLPHIFEPFFSTKRAEVGTGLGLAICRSIVREFRGDIQVESQVDKGTRFVVRLPALRAAPATRDPVPNVEAPALPTVRGRILIVDDEDPLRAMMKRVLADHEVVMAESGGTAEAILEQDRDFDLILCDLMMPDVSGMDVHQWLMKRDPVLAKRVVFITGGAFGPAALEYLSVSGNLKIDKPFETKQLKSVVAERVRAVQTEFPPPPSRQPPPLHSRS